VFEGKITSAGEKETEKENTIVVRLDGRKTGRDEPKTKNEKKSNKKKNTEK